MKIKEEGSTYAIYHSGSSTKTKQQDFMNVDKVWSHVQNVLYSPTCSAGTCYRGKDFDCIFILAGWGGICARELAQMSYHIRHPKNKTVYLAFDKVGDNTAYLLIKQIAKDIETNYRRGIRDYPGIRGLPQKLCNNFLYFEHERLQSMRATRGEVERVFIKMNYKIINDH